MTGSRARHGSRRWHVARGSTGGERLAVAAPQVGQQVPSVYVPQMGDQVVYLRMGHQRFLESNNDKRPPPWEALTVSAQLASGLKHMI